ncbi:hypothetical protein LCGC14_1430230 [marine sediment metagenome]|uniref:DNA polymerase III beta sliding clamp central domain-containing protein n=1 Tax=marine sediment metagenome TaxID=412755 RepID=A0A0F9M4B2_9ZZZZ
MATTISISKDYKVWESAAKEDTRPILQGVYIDPTGYAVAADSFMLAAVPVTVEEGVLPEGGVNIPASFLKAAHKATFKRIDRVYLILGEDSVTSQATDPVMSTPYIQGSFPKWRVLIPKEVNRNHLSILNPALTIRLMAALGLTIPRIAGAAPEVGGPAVFVGEEGAIGAQMPMAIPDCNGLLAEFHAHNGKVAP